MKKFYTLLTLCLAFLGIATATAQNAPELSNEKAYTVKNARSAWATSAEALKTISDLGISEDAADVNQQFAFLTNDEGETYYLYSVGQQKFIKNDGTLSATAEHPVSFKKGNAEGTFVTYFDGSHYINIGGSNQMIIDGWSSADAGNSNVFTIAADFDPTEALKALPAPVVPEFPCIKSISELSNNKLYTVVQKSHSKGATSWAIAAGGDAFVSSKQVEGAVAGQADDTKQQFAFLSYGENIYLYHPAEKKFVNKDATLSATPVDAITLLDGAFKNTFMVKFDDSHYVNVNGEQNMGIDSWSAADGGNSCTITPVADFDPTQALEFFALTSNPGFNNLPATTETLTLTFNKAIQSVNVAILQSTTQEFPPLQENMDYFFWENELSIYLPTEYVMNVQDLTVVLQVIDVDGKPITFSNHEQYGRQEGMIFLQYNVTPVNPEIVEVSPAVGEMNAIEKSIYISFSTEIAEVEVLQLQSSMGELPQLVADKDYFVWGKDLSIVLPIEATAKMSDLLVCLKVKDIQGKYVTYSNYEAYQGVPDMVFLYYTLNPVTPTVEDCGAVDQTITTTTSQIEIYFNTPIAKVHNLAIQSMFGEFPPMVEGTDYSFYDNILTVNIPTQYLENAAFVPEEYQFILLGAQVEDVQGKMVVYSNSAYYPQEAAEQMNMTFLQYNVKPVTKVTTIDPACGFYEVLPSVITLTFDKEISAVEYGMIQTQLTGFRGYIMTENDYVIDGNKLTINVPEEFLVDQSQMQIRMNVVDANGQYVTYAFDPDYGYEGAIILEYTAPVKADLYKMVSSDPAEGVVEKLDVINVAFADAFESVAGGFDPTKEVVVLNADGEVVTKAAMEVVYGEEIYGYRPATNVVKFTLETPVTEAGNYTFVIPAGTVYNEMFYPEAEDLGVSWGAVYNPEVRIAYTIAAPDGINNITVNGKAEVYSLDGRKVKNPTKGIYVVNGKKVYVK